MFLFHDYWSVFNQWISEVLLLISSAKVLLFYQFVKKNYLFFRKYFQMFRFSHARVSSIRTHTMRILNWYTIYYITRMCNARRGHVRVSVRLRIVSKVERHFDRTDLMKKPFKNTVEKSCKWQNKASFICIFGFFVVPLHSICRRYCCIIFGSIVCGRDLPSKRLTVGR